MDIQNDGVEKGDSGFKYGPIVDIYSIRQISRVHIVFVAMTQ